ncbi:hypothetical protein [Burkholderia ambifaria]|uniref:hypothetical protein n=1 Tax=Burkholderia ambifaria TaxID=152480 RepID=UPI001FC7C0E4|nr:hypothetical protein [Burkholderia ambifaria]
MKRQTFTMRIGNSLADAVEAIKQRWKEPSSSEVARRLMEMGVEADERSARLKRSLPEEPGAALHVLRDRYYRNESLTFEEWAFLGGMAHDAYLVPKRTFVTRSLLVDVLRAVRALFEVRTYHTGKTEFPADAYHRSKLDLKDGETLLDGIPRVIAELPKWPDASSAEWLSRPIAGFFNGEEAAIPDELLNQALRPYFASLLALAIRTFWRQTGEPLDDLEKGVSPGMNLRHLANVNVDGLSISTHLIDNRLSGIVDFGDICPMLLMLSSPPALQDFFDLILVGGEAQTDRPEYAAGERRLGLPITQYRKFILWDGDKNFHFSEAQHERLANLIKAAREHPDFAPYERAAWLTWGSI